MSYDVAIVGCGPVGALAANLLGRAGLRTLVLERESELHPLPRAVHIDHEMMRLFQAAGVIDRVLKHVCDTDGHLHVGADHGVIAAADGRRSHRLVNDSFLAGAEAFAAAFADCRRRTAPGCVRWNPCARMSTAPC
jgi:2-polyprenyl-6-methoxyphenol hydroxylase-like FAD-dependent oxidoreductase